MKTLFYGVKDGRKASALRTSIIRIAVTMALLGQFVIDATQTPGRGLGEGALRLQDSLYREIEKRDYPILTLPTALRAIIEAYIPRYSVVAGEEDQILSSSRQHGCIVIKNDGELLEVDRWMKGNSNPYRYMSDLLNLPYVWTRERERWWMKHFETFSYETGERLSRFVSVRNDEEIIRWSASGTSIVTCNKHSMESRGPHTTLMVYNNNTKPVNLGKPPDGQGVVARPRNYVEVNSDCTAVGSDIWGLHSTLSGACCVWSQHNNWQPKLLIDPQYLISLHSISSCGKYALTSTSLASGKGRFTLWNVITGKKVRSTVLRAGAVILQGDSYNTMRLICLLSSSAKPSDYTEIISYRFCDGVQATEEVVSGNSFKRNTRDTFQASLNGKYLVLSAIQQDNSFIFTTIQTNDFTFAKHEEECKRQYDHEAGILPESSHRHTAQNSTQAALSRKSTKLLASASAAAAVCCAGAATYFYGQGRNTASACLAGLSATATAVSLWNLRQLRKNRS